MAAAQELLSHPNRSPTQTDESINNNVQALLTDLYQITMAYGYWLSGKINDHVVFDLFFRKNPFQGEFTIFAGLDDCLTFLETFSYKDSDIEYLKYVLGDKIEGEFFDFLKNLTTKDVIVYAIDEGSVAFPRVPLLRVEGPLIIVQLLETTLLNLVNYASLMVTNGARYRMAAGPNIQLLEFGLRRAQGPNGGLSASKYAYIGGFDGTSNLLAGKIYKIPVCGTHAHAYITSFSSFNDLQTIHLLDKNVNELRDMYAATVQWRTNLSWCFSGTEPSDGELAALISFAIAFPDRFVALIDTYDVKRSGLINFCAVALALNDFGYQAMGIRIDSGDLAYLSSICREHFIQISRKYDLKWFAVLTIVASNDINEETILSLNEQGHQINSFGIGTHLVTCWKQPALGCVYKMVQINGQPCIKLSQDVGKVTTPGHKNVYRLYSTNGNALVDLMQRSDELPPKVGNRVLCRHPFEESKRAYVIPSQVESLLNAYWKDGCRQKARVPLSDLRLKVNQSLKTLCPDIKRTLNPTPYKVAVTDSMYSFLHDLWLANTPIGELS